MNKNKWRVGAVSANVASDPVQKTVFATEVASGFTGAVNGAKSAAMAKGANAAFSPSFLNFSKTNPNIKKQPALCKIKVQAAFATVNYFSASPSAAGVVSVFSCGGRKSERGFCFTCSHA